MGADHVDVLHEITPFTLQGLTHTNQGQSSVSSVSFPASRVGVLGLDDKGCQGLNHGQTQHGATFLSAPLTTHKATRDSKRNHECRLDAMADFQCQSLETQYPVRPPHVTEQALLVQ